MDILENKDIGLSCNVKVLTLEETMTPALNPNFPFIVVGIGEKGRIYVRLHNEYSIFSVARYNVSFPKQFTEEL